MRAILEWLNNIGSDGRTSATSAKLVRPLREAELDHVAAAGASKGGGLGSGGGGSAQNFIAQQN